MEFGFYLPCYWPDTSVPAQVMYGEMLEEAKLAEELGFISLSIPEHHFINYLVHPNPLLTAVKVASVTKSVPLITAVLVLPFYDMRRLAGEVAQADCLTNGRIQLGVGRGAFRYEFDRFGVPVDESRARFDDALGLLIKLLSEEEVSWSSRYYDFEALTITPRPVQRPHPPIWIAALAEGAIEACARRGFNVMTTPLRDPIEAVRKQSKAFFKGLPSDGRSTQRFSMLRMGYVSRGDADTADKVRLAYDNHQRFVNVFTTPGTVRGGAIEPIAVEETPDDIRRSLIIGTPQECVDKLATYAELGIHDIQVNMNFGANHADVMGSLERFALHVMPHFKDARIRVAAEPA